MNTNKARLALNIALDEVDNDIKALKRANKVLMDELEKERLRRYKESDRKVYSKKGFDAYKGEVYFIDGDLHVVVDVEKIAFNLKLLYMGK